MKEFNLEEAKAGKAVCTRDGRAARIICFDRKDDTYPIIALIPNKDNNEDYMSYTIDGRFCDTNTKYENDLMMVGEKKEGWINIYPDNIASTCIYKTKEDAVECVSASCIATIKIEWED